MALIVRFNGGAQAGHGVVTPDGKYHIFAQFGSATLIPGTYTFLSRHFVLHPLRMLVEEEFLQKLGITDAFARTMISADALIITPYHEIANRLREWARGDGRHGSCGIGVGETVKDSLDSKLDPVVARDLLDFKVLRKKLHRLRHAKKEQLYKDGVLNACWNLPEAQEDIRTLLSSQSVETYLAALEPFVARAQIVSDHWGFVGRWIYNAKEAWLLTDLFFGDQGKGTSVDFLARTLGDDAVIFEPAQGVLLDEWRGFHPYTTWSTCTLANAEAVLNEFCFRGKIRRLGIVRAYGTRHGPGPFVTEDAGLTKRLPDPPSAAAQWQGAFRVGWFDAVAVRYAIACVGKLDGLIVTCFDRLAGEPEWKICTRYHTGANIRLGPFGDLAFQERLTNRLFLAKPRYEVSTRAATQEERVAEHVAAIERELGLPVWITSHGPTFNDKTLTRHWEA